jgi:uncharacterized delta-60 repeat protein
MRVPVRLPSNATKRPMSRRAAIAAAASLIIATLGLVLAPAALAAPGDLDPTFGTGGKVTTDFAGGFDEAHALVVQPDGKVVAAGPAGVTGGFSDFGLARYNPYGTLDTTWGTGGKLTRECAS